MSEPLDFDDADLTGRILAAMKEPVSDPEHAIQEMRAHQIAQSSRIRRIERVGWWLFGAILGGSGLVATSVLGLVWHEASERAVLHEQLSETIRRVAALEEP